MNRPKGRKGTLWHVLGAVAFTAVCVAVPTLSSSLASADESDVGTVTTASAREAAAARQPSDVRSSAYEPPLPPESPGIIGEGGCGDSRVPLVKHQNGWSAAGIRGERYLAAIVCAGAYRKNPNSGYFLIVRNRFPGATTKFSQSLVDRSGAVTITAAPLGEEGSARVWDARIEFEGELGTKGYLDLSNDSVHITQGPTACQPDASGTPPNCGEPELGSPRVSPKVRAIVPAGSSKFSTTVRNEGEANAWQVRVCMKVPRRYLVRKRNFCRWVYKLEPGESLDGAFRVNVKRTAKPGSRLPVWFKLTSFDTETTYARSFIDVKRPRSRVGD